MNSTEKKRLQALLSRLCDGDSDLRELNELNSLLANNEEALKEYLAYTNLHLYLGHRLRPSRSAEQLEMDVSGNLKKDARVAKAANRSLSTYSKTTRIAAVLALAAALLVAAVFLIRSDLTPEKFTARIIQKIDCDWGDERWGTPQSADLETGRTIKLDRGLMILEFGNGAEVALEGPIQFEIIAKDRGALRFGKLTASVPKRGHGFVLQVPSGEIVDRGTRFGVMVDQEGNCETHVFEGNVMLRRDSGKQGQPRQEWELAANAAVRFATNSDEIERHAAEAPRFIFSSPSTRHESGAEKPSLKIPAGSDLVLWLEAARRLQLDAQGRIISWGNLISGKNSVADHAWQVDAERRPRWMPETRGGGPAVRFDGSSYLVTTPFFSADDVTLMCAFQAQTRDLPHRRYGQLLNLNGSSSLVLEQTRDHQMIGALVSGRSSQDRAYAGRLMSSLPTQGERVVCAYLYSSSTNCSSLYLNSELVGESQAPQNAAARSPKYIGRSNEAECYFVGDLCEIFVFNSSLTPAQCISLSTDLMEKYGIAHRETEPRVLSGLVPEDE